MDKVPRKKLKEHLQDKTVEHLYIFQEKLLTQSRELIQLKEEMENMKSNHKKQIENLNREISSLKILQQAINPTWFRENSRLTFLNKYQTVRNDTDDWINVPFGIFPISSGIWEYTFRIDTAKPTTTMEIGICLHSDLDQLLCSSHIHGGAGTLIREKGYIYSWSGGDKSKVYIYGANGKAYYPYNVGEIIIMRINMIDRTLSYYRDELLLAQFKNLPMAPLVPIASLANKSHMVSVTLLKIEMKKV